MLRNPTASPRSSLVSICSKPRSRRKTYKGGYSGLLAALHHLLVAHPVGRDEHHLRPPRIVRLLDELHDIRASSSLLRVPESHALRLDTALDETGDGGAERLLLVRTYPDQVPVRTGKGDDMRQLSLF